MGGVHCHVWLRVMIFLGIQPSRAIHVLRLPSFTMFHPPHLRGMDCFGPARFNVLPRLRGSSKNVRCRAKNTRSDPCPPKGDKINPTESIFQYLFEITSGYTTPVKKQRHHRSKVTLYGQATTAACQRAFPLWLGTASCRSPPGPACEWPDVQSPSIYGSKPRKILLWKRHGSMAGRMDVQWCPSPYNRRIW